jgi:hypothetical protein
VTPVTSDHSASETRSSGTWIVPSPSHTLQVTRLPPITSGRPVCSRRLAASARRARQVSGRKWQGNLAVSHAVRVLSLSASKRGHSATAVVSIAPFSLAMRPTFERFRSRATTAISLGDFRHQHRVTAWAVARGCLRTISICTPGTWVKDTKTGGWDRRMGSAGGNLVVHHQRNGTHG